MQKIIIASGPVIVKENKVLLDIQGDDDFWKFCGGKVRENERLEDTAKRRAKEELGIDIQITNNDPFILKTTTTNHNELSDVILVHFLADFSGEVKPGVEVKDWKWIDLQDLEKENLAPNIIPALEYFKFI